MLDVTFADRLTFVLKALSVSRGRLAAEVKVDKSLVGRWCSGAVRPSSPNLERLTEVIAARRPGFTQHSWDASLEALAESFGVPVPAAVAPAANAMFPFPLLSQPSAADAIRGADYEGFWRTTRPSSEMPGQFVHDHVMLRREPSGAMGFTLGVFDVRFHGWAMVQQHQLFVVGADPVSGSFMFAILNGVARQRAEIVDGLVLTCLRDSSGTPIACKCLLERVADLSGDPADDEATLATLAAGFPFSTEAEVPQAVRDHIWTDNGPTAFAAGGDQMLVMRFADTLARGAIFQDPRGVAQSA